MQRKTLKWLVHIYMACSIIGILLLFLSVGSEWLPTPKSGMAFLTIGASSGYIALGTFGAVETSTLWCVMSGIWCALLPAFLIVSYIFAIRNVYIPFTIVAILDALITVAFLLFSWAIQNRYGVESFLPDAIISVVYTCILVIFAYGKPKRIH